VVEVVGDSGTDKGGSQEVALQIHAQEVVVHRPVELMVLVIQTRLWTLEQIAVAVQVFEKVAPAPRPPSSIRPLLHSCQ